MKILWTEHYRPTTLDEVGLSPESRTLLDGYLAAGEIPHLLFHGPPGTGKTTVARILTEQLDCQVLTLNASKDRGIDVIRSQVATFARALYGKPWNIIFLDEADKLTADAQTALRNDMEAYAERTRFILTGNFLHKILDPIQSRCIMMEFARMPLKERVRILRHVLDSEGIEYDPMLLIKLGERHNDMRRLLGDTQQLVIQQGGQLNSVPDPRQEGSGVEALAAIQAKDYNALVRMSKAGGFHHQDALRDMFWAVEGEDAASINARLLISKAVHESAFTPDPVVHFLGTCASLFPVLG